MTGYSIFLQTSTNFCYVGSFLKKQTEWEQHDHCLMSGTFVSSNNFRLFLRHGPRRGGRLDVR